MYWVDRSTGEIVSERDKNKPLWAYYEYLRDYGNGVIIEGYIIGENPFCRIDFAYCVGDKYINLKRDCHFKNHGVDRNNVRLCAITVPAKEYDEKIKELSEKENSMDNTYEPAENKEQEKIKVESIDTIVTMHGDNPYYENKYREVGDKCYHIGYSSYYLDVALEYRKKYFEVVERESDWIPCNERKPKGTVLCCDDRGNMLVGLLCKDEAGYMAYGDDGQEMYNCVAWMPLPEPYREEE